MSRWSWEDDALSELASATRRFDASAADLESVALGLAAVKVARKLPPGTARKVSRVATGALHPATALLRLFDDDRVSRALRRAARGKAGRGVRVGDREVPVGAFLHLIGELASQAAALVHHESDGAESLEYLRTDAEEEPVDALDPQARAAHLLDLLGRDEDPFDDLGSDEWVARVQHRIDPRR